MRGAQQMARTSDAANAEFIEAEVREGQYGSKVAAVEPGGAEFIPLSERHGKPHQQFWTWVSPNMEFATIFVGIIGVWFFGQSFWMATLAIVLGSALGSLSMGFLAARGPLFGVPQMVLSRIGFGFLGNNLVHTFERWSFPVLVIIFAIASVVIVSKAHPGAHVAGVPGGWLITFGAAFGYAAGWNPYASDYTRYLPPNTNRRATGLWAALGVFLSCIALEIVGAAAATITDIGKYADNPTAGFTSHLSPWLADITLLAIALGAVCANALNIYSGSMSFLAMGIKIQASLRRAIVAVVFGVAGFFLALSGLHNAGTTYEDFLLIISYWIGPWLGVFFADQWLRRGKRVDGFLFDRKHNPWAGFAAMALAIAVSIIFFANQTDYIGVVPKRVAGFGDLSFEVGFIVAALLYALFFRLQGARENRDEALHIPEAAAEPTS